MVHLDAACNEATVCSGRTSRAWSRGWRSTFRCLTLTLTKQGDTKWPLYAWAAVFPLQGEIGPLYLCSNKGANSALFREKLCISHNTLWQLSKHTKPIVSDTNWLQLLSSNRAVEHNESKWILLRKQILGLDMYYYSPNLNWKLDSMQRN